MISSAKALKSFIVLFLFYSPLIFAKPTPNGVKNQETPSILAISSQIALPIGIKIWFNECAGHVEGLTTWNEGESFASLGIGHFLWHPYLNQNRASFNSGFPRLIRYIEKRGGKIPTWLHENLYCPWNSRQEFLQAQNSPRMTELRTFLQQTIPLQAEYMVKHLQEILPDLLESTPQKDRALIYHNFSTLARTPAGIYALVDFLNFKGAGISKAPRNYERGSGLLHVLKGMSLAPGGSTPLQAYVWSAKHALIRRVEQAPSSEYRERWLAGWFNRLNTYLEGDYPTAKQYALDYVG